MPSRPLLSFGKLKALTASFTGNRQQDNWFSYDYIRPQVGLFASRLDKNREVGHSLVL